MAGDSLTEAINLIKTGKKAEAQKLLEPFIEANPQNIAAWMWEAETWPSLEGKIKVVELCLQRNPGNVQVQQALKVLKAKQTPSQPPVQPQPQATSPQVPPNLPVQLQPIAQPQPQSTNLQVPPKPLGQPQITTTPPQAQGSLMEAIEAAVAGRSASPSSPEPVTHVNKSSASEADRGSTPLVKDKIPITQRTGFVVGGGLLVLLVIVFGVFAYNMFFSSADLSLVGIGGPAVGNNTDTISFITQSSDVLRALPFAIPVGLNAPLVVSLAGLGIRFGVIQNPPAALIPLSSWPVIVIALILFLVEIVVTSIPFGVASVYDAFVATPILIIGGGALAVLQMSTRVGATVQPEYLVIAFMCSGIGIVHSAKTGVRGLVHLVVPPTIPVLKEGGFNVILDVVGTIFTAICLFVVNHPWLGIGLGIITLVLLIFIAWETLNLIGWTWFRIKATFMDFAGKNYFESEILSDKQRDALGDAPANVIAACRARFKGTKGYDGHLVMNDQQLIFISEVWGGIYRRHIDLAQIKKTFHDRRPILWSLLEVEYPNKKKQQRATFLFFENRKALAKKFETELRATVLR